MTKNLKNMTPTLIPATLEDYPCIQNMARFYVYDLSRECGSISSEWALPEDGLYECFDFKNYFFDSTRKAYLVKIADELVGFVLIDQEVKAEKSTWNMGELFVLAKFQSKGIGRQVVSQILEMHPGIWEVSVIPENVPGLSFWKKIIEAYTNGSYTQETKIVTFDKHQPKRIIFTFDTCSLKAPTYNHGEPIEGTPFMLYNDANDAYKIIDQKLFEFNKSCVPATQSPEVIDINFTIKNGDEIIAGICADVYIWKILYISVFFIEETYRNQGLGTILLDKVEEKAKQLGVTLAHLDTFDWQAKDFYLKYGYEVFGVLTDCPKGHTRYYMKKIL